MSELTQEEIEGIVQAIHHSPSEKEQPQKVPLRPPGQFKKMGKVSFSPLEGERPKPLESLTELGILGNLHAHVDVVYGKTTLPLNTLMALEPGSLLPLHELCDELVDIYVNGVKIGRGEIVTSENRFGVKIVTLDT